jgi:hypothetical protein
MVIFAFSTMPFSGENLEVNAKVEVSSVATHVASTSVNSTSTVPSSFSPS